MNPVALALALAAATAPPAAEPITAPGPAGPLAGTLVLPAPGRPVVLILPGSGPTDRDGNNRMGIRAAPYRLLAEALAARGIGSVRIDKRGLFGSAGAVPDPNAVTLADYAADTRAWIAATRARTGANCVWLLGHSEGGLVALATAAGEGADDICGLVLVAAPGRPMGAIIKEQLAANPANAPLLPAADAALDRLAAGGRVDPATIPPPLLPLFAPAIQGYLISLLAADPAALAARVRSPVLILQGTADIQVSVADARALARANPAATLRLMPHVNHVLKVAGEDRAANVATYADPDLPLAPGVAEAVADFVTAPRPR